jgi:hypothetical protein
MNEPLVSRYLRYALYVIFVLGVVGTVTLPFMLDFYMLFLYDAYSLRSGYRLFITLFLMGVAVPGLWIVLEMIWMLRSIPEGPFVARNVRALNRSGIILMLMAAAFFGKCFLYVTIMSLAAGLLLVVCGLFAFTLANLFGQAVAFREENDLTI